MKRDEQLTEAQEAETAGRSFLDGIPEYADLVVHSHAVRAVIHDLLQQITILKTENAVLQAQLEKRATRPVRPAPKAKGQAR